MAVPVGLVLALVTKNVSSGRQPRSSGCCSTPWRMIPGGLAYAMLRARHAAAALWPAALAFLVAVSTLLISAVALA